MSGLNRQAYEARVAGGETPATDQAYEREKLLVDSDVLKGLAADLMHMFTPGGHFYLTDCHCECEKTGYCLEQDSFNCEPRGGGTDGRLDGSGKQLQLFEHAAQDVLRTLHKVGVFPTSTINGRATIMVTRTNITVVD